MNKKTLTLLFCVLLGCGIAMAEDVQKSELQQRAEAIDANKNIASARSTYIRAFEDYAAKGHIRQAAECGANATALYYKENMYQEAFDLLRNIDQTINSSSNSSGTEKAAAHYMTSRERMQMYMKMRRPANTLENTKPMENYANQSGDAQVKNELHYNKKDY